MDIHNPTACEDKEPFALRVIGESMAPEFQDGAVIIIDPGYPAVNGAYVLALYQKEYHFRQWVRRDDKDYLVPLNALFHSLELEGHYQIIGVISQQCTLDFVGIHGFGQVSGGSKLCRLDRGGNTPVAGQYDDNRFG